MTIYIDPKKRTYSSIIRIETRKCVIESTGLQTEADAGTGISSDPSYSAGDCVDVLA